MCLRRHTAAWRDTHASAMREACTLHRHSGTCAISLLLLTRKRGGWHSTPCRLIQTDRHRNLLLPALPFRVSRLLWLHFFPDFTGYTDLMKWESEPKTPLHSVVTFPSMCSSNIKTVESSKVNKEQLVILFKYFIQFESQFVFWFWNNLLVSELLVMTLPG